MAVVFIDVSGRDTSRRLDPISVEPASRATGSWPARDFEAVVGSTTSNSGPLGADHSCGGYWFDLVERDFDYEDRRFPDEVMVDPRTSYVSFDISTDSRSGAHL